jgi:hypothetical protein
LATTSHPAEPDFEHSFETSQSIAILQTPPGFITESGKRQLMFIEHRLEKLSETGGFVSGKSAALTRFGIAG